MIALLSLASPLEAQWTDFPSAADSPYWWTLTDLITPSELRASLQDRDDHRERFRAAAAAGRRGEMVTERQIHEVVAYLDGSVRPDLIPTFLAFESFAARFDYMPDWQKTSAQLLAEHGVSSEGVGQILEMVDRYTTSREQIKAEVAAPVTELMGMVRAVGREIGNERVQSMLVAGDIAALAERTGRDAATIARLHAAWKRQPIVEASLPVLVELRESLNAEDWNAFRALLLAEVASGMSALETNNSR